MKIKDSAWIVSLNRINNGVLMKTKNGNIYFVLGVGSEIYDRWNNALSKGKFYYSDIYGIYKIKRLK